jgi:hypothetical protein
MLLATFAFLAVMAVAVRAEDAPDPFKALAGGWRRPLLAPNERADVIAELYFREAAPDAVHRELFRLLGKDKGKTRSLVVGGGPVLSIRNVLEEQFVRYDVAVSGGKGKGELSVEVGGKRVRMAYTLDRDTLTIVTRDRLPAGRYLGKYDISGTWERFGATHK